VSCPESTPLLARGSLAFSVLVLCTTAASAVSMRVQRACAGDYMAYCSQHDPDGPGVHRCMRANGLKLSKGRVLAFIAAGEVTKTIDGRPPTPRAWK
jgi:hypothetical protein